MSVRQPDSVEAAVGLLAASVSPVDSPTQRRIRDADQLRAAFAAGRRRPDLVWTDGTDVVAALQVHRGLLVLDHFSADAGTDLLAHATAGVAGLGGRETGVFRPPGAVTPAVQRLMSSLGECGWRVLVDRLHYEFDVAAGLGDDVPTALRLTTPESATDPRLRAAVAGSLVDTADAHDRDELARVGAEQVTSTNLAALLEDGVGSIRLAADEHGADVGIVCGLTTASGRGFLSFVGVMPEHRGHGYATQLVAWMTRQLIADGADVLVADTDTTNVAMARAFARVGWPVTEIRTDLVLDSA